MLSIATAGANGETSNEPGIWSLWISDAQSAFLQGEQNREERGGLLFMKAPRDALVSETGKSAEMYGVLGNGYGYGLPGAPRIWSRRVVERAIENGFKQHGFDRCPFYLLDTWTRRTGSAQ